MGFRTLAIQQRSSEVWELLGTVKSEFGKYADVLAKVKKKLTEAINSRRRGRSAMCSRRREPKRVRRRTKSNPEIVVRRTGRRIQSLCMGH